MRAVPRSGLLSVLVAALLISGCGGDDDGGSHGERFVATTTTLTVPATWSSVAATLSDRLEPSSPNVCTRGEGVCIEIVLDEMRRRLATLEDACDHDAVFALAYLRVTEAVGRAAAAGRFANPAFMRHMDAVFAAAYFDAFDRWHSADRTGVPSPWRGAFDAADREQVSGMGDLLLAMNAHITHDLVVVIDRVGAGPAEKADYDAINGLLGELAPDMMADVAARLDPTVGDVDVARLGVGGGDIASVFAAWRDTAWVDAQTIATLDEAQRPAAFETIDAQVGANAVALRAATSYVPFLVTPEARDTLCASR